MIKSYNQFFESLKNIPTYKRFYLLKKQEEFKREFLFILEDEDKGPNFDEYQDDPFYSRWIKDRESRYDELSTHDTIGNIKKDDFYYMVYTNPYSQNVDIKIYSKDNLNLALEDSFKMFDKLNKEVFIRRFVATHNKSFTLKTSYNIKIENHKTLKYDVFINDIDVNDFEIWEELLKCISKICPKNINTIVWPEKFVNSKEEYKNLISSAQNISKFNL